MYTDTHCADRRKHDSIPQMTVLVTQIAAFLCPSDVNPGSSSTFLVGGETKLVGASNYACNIGLNRRITGSAPDDWVLNGPNYVASSWDKTVRETTNMASLHGWGQQRGNIQRVGQGSGRANRPSPERAGGSVQPRRKLKFLPDRLSVRAALQYGADHQRQSAVAMEG